MLTNLSNGTALLAGIAENLVLFEGVSLIRDCADIAGWKKLVRFCDRATSTPDTFLTSHQKELLGSGSLLEILISRQHFLSGSASVDAIQKTKPPKIVAFLKNNKKTKIWVKSFFAQKHETFAKKRFAWTNEHD